MTALILQSLRITSTTLGIISLHASLSASVVQMEQIAKNAATTPPLLLRSISCMEPMIVFSNLSARWPLIGMWLLGAQSILVWSALPMSIIWMELIVLLLVLLRLVVLGLIGLMFKIKSVGLATLVAPPVHR